MEHIDVDDDITITDDSNPTPEPKVEAAPSWASAMADTMRALADKVTAPTAPTNSGLTKDQVDDINTRITKGIVDGNPLGTLAPLAGQVATEIVDNRLSPVVAEAVEGFVDRFRSRKREDAEDKGQAALYRQVSRQFDKELEGEDLSKLVAMPKQARDKILNRAWKAATGDVLEKRVAVRSDARPAGASAAGGSNSGEGNKSGGYKLSERERRQLYRSMSKEAADAAIAEIEGALVGATE
jgi:hypothetical protein